MLGVAMPMAAQAVGVLDQSQEQADGNDIAMVGSQAGFQTFTAGRTGDLAQVDLLLTRFGAPGNLAVEIRDVEAGLYNSPLIASATVADQSLDTDPYSFEWAPVALAPTVPVQAGHHYAIVLRDGGSSNFPSEFFGWGQSDVDPYAGGVGGSTFGPTEWYPAQAVDYGFRTYVVPAPDTTPPTITAPIPVTVDATSRSGAVVTYTASVADNLDPNPNLVCAPASGSQFAIGDTTVTCIATDASGNTATATFRVHVRGAAEEVVNLIATVDGYGLSKLGTSLDDKLVAAQRGIAANKLQQVCDNVASFLAQVQSQSGKGLGATQATYLSGAANRIATLVGC
jgi:hypothetical protein